MDMQCARVPPFLLESVRCWLSCCECCQTWCMLCPHYWSLHYYSVLQYEIGAWDFLVFGIYFLYNPQLKNLVALDVNAPINVLPHHHPLRLQWGYSRGFDMKILPHHGAFDKQRHPTMGNLTKNCIKYFFPCQIPIVDLGLVWGLHGDLTC